MMNGIQAALSVLAILIGLGLIWICGYIKGRVDGVRSGFIRGIHAEGDSSRYNAAKAAE